MPVTEWIDPLSIIPFPYQFVAIFNEDDNSNFNNDSEDPGNNPHLIVKYRETGDDEEGLYLSYKVKATNGIVLQGNFKINRIRYEYDVLDGPGYEEEHLVIEYKPVNNVVYINKLRFIRRHNSAGGPPEHFVSQTVNGATQRIKVDRSQYDFLADTLNENMPEELDEMPPNDPVLPAPAPVPAPGPLPGSTPVLGGDLVPGDHYHVWTREGAGFKYEGHGKFVRRQNGGRDTLFEPFTIESGAPLESQVFEVANSAFYKLTNIKGGKRKSRKVRKTKKSRKVRKTNKSRKSRRNMRR